MKVPAEKPGLTIQQAIESYLREITLARSENTARTYKNALGAFSMSLAGQNIQAHQHLCETLSEDAILDFASALKVYAPATERLYLTAVSGFYQFLAAEKLAEINLPRLRLLIQRRARRPGQRLPQFPKEKLEKLLDYANNLAILQNHKRAQRLRNLRDRAFLLTLADTGLRVHEACALRRGDIDWNESKAVIIGKGDRQAIIRFSKRSLRALREYLRARSKLDGGSGKALRSLPLFARHDRGAGKKIKPITTATGRNIVTQRVKEALGTDAVGSITPHSFRHYFVTTVLRGSGGNLKMAQELARHRNIAVTQRYAHLSDDELDRGYADIFDEDPDGW